MNIESSGSNTRIPLIILTSLFFMWGFLTCLNDILIPHLRNVFSLNYFQAALVQFCFFGAYFLVSLPAGNLVKRIGYQRGIVIGLVIAAVGCFGFYPAAAARSYPIFLGALFVLASGITLLQVSANPYVTVLGPSETASSRLTLTQAFNSFGTFLAPFFGAAFILAVGNEVVGDIAQLSAAELEQYRQHEVETVQMPYLLLSLTLLALAIIFHFLKLPKIEHAEDDNPGANEGSAWQHRHLVLGMLAIFVYVGAEVSIGSFLVNFLGEERIAGLDESEAAQLIAYYWGGAMVGRFIGAAVMRYIPGQQVLAFNACAVVVLIIVAMSSSGSLAMWAILGVGLFNSVMFPTIFSLALRDLGPLTGQGSGILCMGIVGGALVPLLQGAMADSISLQLSFLIPAVCYLYIIYYGLKGYRAS